MDKVVTKMDPYQKNHHLEKMVDKLTLQDDDETKARHDTYPLDDGSTLLERVQPGEAITSTTIARETFIVRPANGDINNIWMDVTHKEVDNSVLPSTNHVEEQQQQQKQKRNAEHESIVLDIAGYKTQNGHEEQDRNHHDHHHDKMNNVLDDHDDNHGTAVQQNNIVGSPRSIGDRDVNEKNIDNEVERKEQKEQKGEEEKKLDGINEKRQENSTLKERASNEWGWGKKRRQSTTSSLSSSSLPLAKPSRSSPTSIVGTQKKLQLEPGIVYRIELSLCGLTTFGRKEEENAKLFNQYQITYDTFVHNPNLLNDKRLVFRYEGRYYAAGRTGPLFTSLFLFHEPLDEKTKSSINQNKGDDEKDDQDSDSRESYLFGHGWRQWWSRSSVTRPTADLNSTTGKDESVEVSPEDEKGKNNNNNNKTTTRLTTTTTTTSVGWHPDHKHEHHSQTEQQLEQNLSTLPSTALPHKNYAKTLRLTSDQLKSLGLKKGANTVSFSVTTEYQGTATCIAQIFFWDYDIQIVISDIDGTITKSDALGHVFNFIGKDWTHIGVAKLYTDITNNGYHMLYLTSRAIGQADYTRDYLKRVEQDGKYQLPPGPVIMSPDRLFTSFHREVIMRKPEVFKMACLRDIQRLFGGYKPFYAGFGNRITDAISYRSVDVPASRIFTIDPNGDVKLELLLGFLSSYIDLTDLVDHIFPPIVKNKNVGEEFNDWNYWKQPLPEIDIPGLTSETSSSLPLSNGDTTSNKGETTPVTSTATAATTAMSHVSTGSTRRESLLPPVSPKPVPIKPDPTKSLPSESIIESEAQKQRQRSILLRTFTSRSSSTSTTKNTSEMNNTITGLSSRLGTKHFSTSTPSLISITRSGRTSPTENVRSASPTSHDDDKNNNSEKQQPSTIHHHSPDNLITGPNHSDTTILTPPVPSSASSSSSLMNKMTTGFGGVLSRTFATRKSSLSEELLDHPATLSRTNSKGEEPSETFELEDEDEELDLDSIPFI
ncbi:Lipin/Ned1/Smp2-domain-containing protein [Circinella umbellata]|nr:Lipin/Ned1/Smp2-domain-containing protein [Circinella umbellata]